MAHNPVWWENRYGGGAPRLYDPGTGSYLPISGRSGPSRWAVWASNAYRAGQAIPVIAGMLYENWSKEEEKSYPAPNQRQLEGPQTARTSVLGKRIKAQMNRYSGSGRAKKRKGRFSFTARYVKGRRLCRHIGPRKHRMLRKRRRYKRRQTPLRRLVNRIITEKNHQSVIQDYRISGKGQINVATNVCDWTLEDFLTATQVKAQLASTLPTIAAGAGGAFQWVKLDGSDSTAVIKTVGGHMKIHFRNNYNVRINLEVYPCVASDNTDVNVYTLYQEALDDLAYTGVSQIGTAETDVMYNVKDVRGKMKLKWDVKKPVKIQILPAEEKTLTFALPRGYFDMHKYNMNATTYRRGFSFALLIRAQGSVAHGDSEDVESTLVGWSACKCDYIIECFWKYRVMSSRQQKIVKSTTGTNVLTKSEQMEVDKEEHEATDPPG